jgi:hypothetical protein
MWKFSHKPSLSRKVRMPDSAEIPAPVKTTTRCCIMSRGNVPRYFNLGLACELLGYHGRNERFWVNLDFGNPNEASCAESLEDFDETLCLELRIKGLITGIDTNGFQSDEFGRRGHAQNVVETDQSKHGW